MPDAMPSRIPAPGGSSRNLSMSTGFALDRPVFPVYVGQHGLNVQQATPRETIFQLGTVLFKSLRNGYPIISDARYRRSPPRRCWPHMPSHAAGARLHRLRVHDAALRIRLYFPVCIRCHKSTSAVPRLHDALTRRNSHVCNNRRFTQNVECADHAAHPHRSCHRAHCADD